MSNFLANVELLGGMEPLDYETYKMQTSKEDDERNKYAVKVLAQTKTKLQSEARLTEQVDLLIKEATDPSLLSAMYHGWMSWI